MADDEEVEGKLLYERKRTRLQKIGPHETKPWNPIAAGAILAVLVATMVGGWYVMHPSAEKQERARQQAEEKKDRMSREAAEREGQKQ